MLLPLFLFILIFSPLAFGTVEYWSLGTVEAVVPATLLLLCLRLQINNDQHHQRERNHKTSVAGHASALWQVNSIRQLHDITLLSQCLNVGISRISLRLTCLLCLSLLLQVSLTCPLIIHEIHRE